MVGFFCISSIVITLTSQYCAFIHQARTKATLFFCLGFKIEKSSSGNFHMYKKSLLSPLKPQPEVTIRFKLDD